MVGGNATILKASGFLCSLGFFLWVVFNLFFVGLHSIDWLVFLFSIALYLFVFLALPELSRASSIKSLKEGSHLFASALNRVVVSAALVVVYIVGVGPVWVVSRAFGKRFMAVDGKGKRSFYLLKEKKKIGLEEMF